MFWQQEALFVVHLPIESYSQSSRRTIEFGTLVVRDGNMAASAMAFRALVAFPDAKRCTRLARSLRSFLVVYREAILQTTTSYRERWPLDGKVRPFATTPEALLSIVESISRLIAIDNVNIGHDSPMRRLADTLLDICSDQEALECVRACAMLQSLFYKNLFAHSADFLEETMAAFRSAERREANRVQKVAKTV